MGKAHMGRSLKQAIHIPISHSCLSAGIGLDMAAQHPCVFTAARDSSSKGRPPLAVYAPAKPASRCLVELHPSRAQSRVDKALFWLPLYIFPSVNQEGPSSFIRSFQLKTRAPGSSSEIHWVGPAFVYQSKCDLTAGTLMSHPFLAI